MIEEKTDNNVVFPGPSTSNTNVTPVKMPKKSPN